MNFIDLALKRQPAVLKAKFLTLAEELADAWNILALWEVRLEGELKEHAQGVDEAELSSIKCEICDCKEKIRIIGETSLRLVGAEPVPISTMNFKSQDRTTEMKWLENHHSEVCRKYGGQWIAIEGDKLVGHGLRLKDALDVAEQNGVLHPFVVCIPKPMDGEIAVIGGSETAL